METGHRDRPWATELPAGTPWGERLRQQETNKWIKAVKSIASAGREGREGSLWPRGWCGQRQAPRTPHSPRTHHLPDFLHPLPAATWSPLRHVTEPPGPVAHLWMRLVLPT